MIKEIRLCDMCLAEKQKETPGAESRDFSTDDGPYEIDVCPRHDKLMYQAFAVFIENARRLRRPGYNPPKPPKRDRARSRAIRDWARQHDMPVNDKGRIPESVELAYDQRAS
jgi:hypothetical protein